MYKRYVKIKNEMKWKKVLPLMNKKWNFIFSEVNIVMFNANTDRGEGDFQSILCKHDRPRIDIDTNSGSRPH